VTRLQIEIPMPLPSAANLREHKGEKMSRVKRQRRTVATGLHFQFGPVQMAPPLPADVLLTRIAPRPLDDDNLSNALKAARDTVADWLGLPDDRDPRVRWLYGQAVDPQRRPKYQALRVTIAPREDCPTCGKSTVDVSPEQRAALHRGIWFLASLEMGEVEMIERQAAAVAEWLRAQAAEVERQEANSCGYRSPADGAWLEAAEDLDGIKAVLKGAIK